MENARIEAFVLSPPEGAIAEDAGYGKIFIRIGVLFPRAKPALITAAVESLRDGVAGGGRLSVDDIAALLRFASDSGGEPIEGLDAASGEGRFRTNAYFDAPK